MRQLVYYTTAARNRQALFTKKFIFLGNCAVKSKDDDYGIHLDDEIDKFRKLSMCNFKFMIPQLIKDYIWEYGNR